MRTAEGKSSFAIKALRDGLRQRPARHVVYASGKTPYAWVFRENSSGDGHTVVPFNRNDAFLLNELADPRTLYISDSLRPDMVKAFTIMITSPRRDRYLEFSKAKPVKMLVFPPFSRAEIDAMHRTCFPDVPADLVRDNFALAGGIPRAVFTCSHDEVIADIKAAATGVDLEQMIVEMESNAIIESPEKRSHRFVHMLPAGVVDADGGDPPSPKTDAFYKPARLVLASNAVAKFAYEKAERSSKLRLHKLLAEPPSSPLRAAIYQAMYEGAVLSELTMPVKLRCWHAHSRTISTLELKETEIAYFSDVADLAKQFAADPTRLFVPDSKTFTAIDAVLPGGLLAQVTISLSHDVKIAGRGTRSREGLVPVHQALQPTAATNDVIDLYWILPQQRFDELVLSNTASFPIIVPDEVKAAPQLAELKQLEREALNAEAAWKDAQGTATEAAEKAKMLDAQRRAKEKHNALAPRRRAWAAERKRVRHHAVCLQFPMRGGLIPARDAAAATTLQGTLA